MSLRDAKQALAQGRHSQAATLALDAASMEGSSAGDVRAAFAVLREALTHGHRPRALCALLTYDRELEAAQRLATEPRDEARVWSVRGDATKAADAFERAGWFAHAATRFEGAGTLARAFEAWSKLERDGRLRRDAYVHGLVLHNLSRVARGLGEAARAQALHGASVRRLEEAAFAFEEAGLRERAFDCHQVLIALGRGGAFENLAEGYLNAIRVLAADDLRFFALQYYEDFAKLASERREFQASAATLRDAAEYARRQGLPFADHYRVEAARAYRAAAEALGAAGAPPALLENAGLAAAESFVDAGSFSEARAVYDSLANAPLPDARRARYAALAARLEGAIDPPWKSGGLPAYLRSDAGYVDVWFVDVEEWEARGAPEEVMAKLAYDPRVPEPNRRYALLARVALLAASDPGSPETLVSVAPWIAATGAYDALGPLEVMLDSRNATVRRAVAAGLRRLFFKRSFGAVERCLSDPNAEVRREAIEAVRALHFPHAIEPLARFVRQSRDAQVRVAALGALGRIATRGAVEELIAAAGIATSEERAVIRQALTRVPLGDTATILRDASVRASPSVAALLAEVLDARG